MTVLQDFQSISIREYNTKMVLRRSENIIYFISQLQYNDQFSTEGLMAAYPLLPSQYMEAAFLILPSKKKNPDPNAVFLNVGHTPHRGAIKYIYIIHI